MIRHPLLSASTCVLACYGCSALVSFDDLSFHDTTSSSGGGNGGEAGTTTSPGGMGGSGGMAGEPSAGGMGGSGGSGAADTCADPTKRVVFITPTPIAPGGGITSLTQHCNGAAAGHCGNKMFVAWASQQQNMMDIVVAKDEIPEGAWYRTDGILVASNKMDLTDGSIAATINRTPNGMQVGANIRAWTGTLADGTQSFSDCSLWMSTSNGQATIGATNALDGNWTATSTPAACSATHHVYCFQTSP